MTPTEALARALEENALRATVGVAKNADYWPRMADLTLTALAALGYEVRPIPPNEYGGCGSLAWTVEAYGRVTHKHSCPNRITPYCQTHPTGYGCEPIEQAAEERSSESGDPDTRGRASGFAPSSAAVAPLEPIPTDWGVGPLTHPVAVAPSSAEVGGSLDVEALVAALDFITSRFGSEAHDVGGVWGVVRRELPAAYADAIRKRDPDPTGGGA